MNRRSILPRSAHSASAHDGTTSLGKHRIEWIDVSKAGLISLMVFAHASLPDGLRKVICSFHMPAFFIISGYLFRSQNWKRVLLPFVLPVLFFSLLHGAVILGFANCAGNDAEFAGFAGAVSLFRRGLFGFVRTSFPTDSAKPVTLFVGLWFIWALVGARLFLSFSFFVRHWKTGGICCAFFLLFQTYWSEHFLFPRLHLYKAISAIPFMVVGMELKRLRCDPRRIGRFSALALAVVWGVSLWAIWSVRNVDMSSNVFGDFGYIPFFSGAVSGSLLFFGICSRMKSGSVLTLLSTGTIVIMGLHWPVFRFVGPVVRRLHLPGKLLSALFITMSTLSVCLLAIVFSKRHCPALLGKPHSTRGARESVESKESVPH